MDNEPINNYNSDRSGLWMHSHFKPCCVRDCHALCFLPLTFTVCLTSCMAVLWIFTVALWKTVIYYQEPSVINWKKKEYVDLEM